MGKASQSTKKYTGSFAVVLGFGPADSLISIDDGQNIVWPLNHTTLVSFERVDTTGAIYRNTAMDSDGKTVLQTSVGNIRFYWGTPDQNVDSLLASLQLDQGLGVFANVPMPSYKNLIYYVADNIKLGSSPSAPRLFFTFSRFSSGLNLPSGISRVAVSDGGVGYLTSPAVQITGDGTGAAAIAKIKNGAISEITVTEQGSGYTTAAIAFVGGLNTGPQVTALATASVHFGSIDGITITNNGQNYAEIPTVTIAGDGTGASAVAAINDAGQVSKITILDSGKGYTTATVTISGGFARAGAAAALVFHELNGDSILPEAIYDLFVNRLYGLGIDPGSMEISDFVNSCIQIVSEDLGVSPYLDKASTIRADVKQ